MTETFWRVGEVARRSGLSVRTLHHYDDLGLLSPAHRSEAGYRLYSAADVARLQQIMSLRELGLPLEEIRTLLDRPDISPRRVIELHLQQLREQMELQRELCRRLELIAAQLAGAEEVSADELFHTMEVLSNMDRITTYYTPEQLETLAKRRQELGEEEVKRVEAEWPDLIARMRAEMERGTDPADEHVQALARRWRELVEAFTGGDAGIAQSLQTMYRNEPEVAGRFGPDPELFAYVGKAMAAER
ncbi:MAG TPA: MerR family transcriptional regulator [Chloroflexota bacterium]|nr:MerR family transcriptional regulator [Chloroflexota bacterium]